MTLAAGSRLDHAVYVFGIVDAAGFPDGVDHDLAEGVQVVRNGPVAAIVAGAEPEPRRGGLSSQLRRHDRVVAGFVDQGITILPMRFGAVIAEPEVLSREVLAPNRDAFVAALRDLDGVVQYNVRVDYVRDALLGAVMHDDPRIAAARSAAAGAGRDRQVRLGELIVRAIDRRRAGDAARIGDELGSLVNRFECDVAQDPDRLADFACLVDRTRGSQFEDALEALAERHHEAVRMTLLGPLAPYHFVPEL